jgi:hypothetical protein
MKIDLLYFAGCPSWQDGLENLKVALIRENLRAELNLVRVDTDTEAARLQFLGSPSFRVNGEELWQEQREQYNLSCRVYSTPGGMKGAPTVEMLQEKLSIFQKS